METNLEFNEEEKPTGNRFQHLKSLAGKPT